ncbi:hypothetical protein FCR2A7T_06790 [Flavobacterium cauense R2A-7]|nr:hypothetical protein FCR2A7T_06790 [Flavobacterium cauense R2A-7]
MEFYYKLPSKKVWKNYKKYEPKISQGQISRNGKLYTLTEIIDSKKSEKIRYAKFTNRKLLFYLKTKDGKLEKLYSMKRKS